MIFFRISYRHEGRLLLDWARKESDATTRAAQVRMDRRLKNGQVWVDQVEIPTLQKDALLIWLQDNVGAGE